MYIHMYIHMYTYIYMYVYIHIYSIYVFIVMYFYVCIVTLQCENPYNTVIVGANPARFTTTLLSVREVAESNPMKTAYQENFQSPVSCFC